MHTPYTRQYQQNKKHWFEVWPVVEVAEDTVSVMRASEKLPRQDIAVVGDAVIDTTGFIVMSQSTRQLQYITAAEAENYVKPVR